MSEQEKKSGGGAGGSSVVLVEQSGASRHKQPFRPTELQEEAPDLHHKRSRAPAVPSAVAEELKDNANSETKDRRECERDISSEKQKHSMAKKLSATAKRRESSPEVVPLQKLEADTKRGTATPRQPIPAQVASLVSVASDVAVEKSAAEKKEDEDSITDEIAELRTPEVAKKASEWEDNHDKRKVSWHVLEHQEKLKIQEVGARSRACVLERKSSIGPCFRSAAPFGGPSGIAICLSNKNATPAAGEGCYSGHKSVINITLSKKCLVNKTNIRIENKDKELANQIPRGNFFGILREKLANMRGKIRNVLHA